MTNLNLSIEEWRVVKYIDPKNTMKQIASAAKLTDMEIRRIVYGLIQAGLVEMVRPLSPHAAPQINPGCSQRRIEKNKRRSSIN